MKKNPHLYLSEVLFASADKAESKAISKMLKEGVIRKIAITSPNHVICPL